MEQKVICPYCWVPVPGEVRPSDSRFHAVTHAVTHTIQGPDGQTSVCAGGGMIAPPFPLLPISAEDFAQRFKHLFTLSFFSEQTLISLLMTMIAFMENNSWDEFIKRTPALVRGIESHKIDDKEAMAYLVKILEE